MKNLLEFILKSITGSSECRVEEQTGDGDHINLIIYAPQEIMGLIIGKNGKTIKAIRSLIKVRATLEKKGVSISIAENSSNPT
ncbi:MAG: KH domain-containing protein [Candidatus Microgenomates bacterium]|jgi:predicted RNA-binding protein YlqC (UPF0109 family)